MNKLGYVLCYLSTLSSSPIPTQEKVNNTKNIGQQQAQKLTMWDSLIKKCGNFIYLCIIQTAE